MKTKQKKPDKPEIKQLRMKRYRCEICGYVYEPSDGEPSDGINPGTSFEDLPADYICPLCGASKSEFREYD